MRHARRTLRRLVRLAAAGGLVLGGLMTSGAMAAGPGGGPGEGSVAGTSGLLDRLGTGRTAGSWTAADGRTVVAVTDAAAAREVRAAGARPEFVRHSADRLRAAVASLRAAPRVPGTAWSVDYAANEVTVRADGTVSAADWARMSSLAEGIGDRVRMERTRGRFTTRVNGADSIVGPGRRCSAGFNVTDGRDAYLLTAGHCGPGGAVWAAGEQTLATVGTTVVSAFPGTDFAAVRYENPTAADRTNTVSVGGGRGVRIVGLTEPVVGAQVFRSGSTTGLRTGRVTAVDATVNYPEGTVTGLIETTVCAEPGDSGGPLFSEGLALGVTSGGDGDCAAGGTTYFQPVGTALEALGMRLSGITPPPGPADGGAAPPPATAAPPASGAAPGTPGAPVARRRSEGIVGLDDPGVGIGIIGVSLAALVAARWVASAEDRREFRTFQTASWG
ncbi:S1 family peptidase [Streptomyces zhihengii]|uniref:S1 family peptidase n=1 Tax=Streptomyces zhihengii TaxID=1818004 RepID=UPI0036354600